MLAKLAKTELADILPALEQYCFKCGSFKVKKNLSGFVNETYFVIAGGKKFVLRRSSVRTSIRHLKLEVALLDYLKGKRFKFSPRVLPNKLGQKITIYKGRYFTLQNFLPGRWLASWNNLTKYGKAMLVNHFRVQAKFSRATSGFRYQKLANNRPVFYYAQNGERLLKKLLVSMPASPGRNLLQNKQSEMLSFIRRTKREMQAAGYDKLSQQIVHFDLHPGNLHFQDNRVTGMFDFDWVRWDSRISDLASTICQSCYYYRGLKAGLYRKDRIWLGIKSYRGAYGKNKFPPALETHLTKLALKAYVFYQLLFSSEWYVENIKQKDSVDVIKHFIKVIELNDYERLFC